VEVATESLKTQGRGKKSFKKMEKKRKGMKEGGGGG
jgi:hypothetical protein